MHDDLSRARGDHEAATRGWRELLAGLAPDDANRKPVPTRWSVAQCLEHVCIVTGAVLPGLDAAIARARADGTMAEGPFRYGPVGRWFLAAQAPGSGRAVPTVRRYAPSSSEVDLEAAVARFEAVHAAFTVALEAADGVHLARVRVASPVTKLLRLQAGIWFLALPVHALRHLAQAERVVVETRTSTG